MPRLARVRTLAGLAIAGALLGGLRVALAQSASFTLTWTAPADCPDPAYVQGAIDQLLSGGPRPTAVVDARALVTRDDTGQWHVKLTIVRDGTSGERTLDAPSCRSLADATALIVALTIDPTRVAANRAALDASAPATIDDAGAPPDSPSSADPDAAPTAPDAAPPVPPPPPVTGPPSTSTDHFALFPAFGADLGSLPNPAYGFTVAAGFLLGPLRLEGYGSYWPPQKARLPLHPVDGGDVQLWDAGARGCYALFRRPPLELAPCAGFEVGSMHGQGVGVAFPTSVSSLWVGLTASGRGSWRIVGPLGLALDVGVVVPLHRDEFVLDVLGTVHQAFPIVGRALLGPELRF